MYKVEFKASNAGNAWQGYGTYGSETSAMQSASRIAGKFFAVRVTKNGQIIWVA